MLPEAVINPVMINADPSKVMLVSATAALAVPLDVRTLLSTAFVIVVNPVPDVPLDPDDPDVPEEPEEPEVPVLPELPDVPELPRVPDVPELPLEPELPLLPDDPFVPLLPDVPDDPLVPLLPAVPELPLVPLVPAGVSAKDAVPKNPTPLASELVKDTAVTLLEALKLPVIAVVCSCAIGYPKKTSVL